MRHATPDRAFEDPPPEPPPPPPSKCAAARILVDALDAGAASNCNAARRRPREKEPPDRSKQMQSTIKQTNRTARVDYEAGFRVAWRVRDRSSIITSVLSLEITISMRRDAILRIFYRHDSASFSNVTSAILVGSSRPGFETRNQVTTNGVL